MFGRVSTIHRTTDPIDSSIMCGLAGWTDSYYTGEDDDEQVEVFIRTLVRFDALVRLSEELDPFVAKLKTPPTGPEFI